MELKTVQELNKEIPEIQEVREELYKPENEYIELPARVVSQSQEPAIEQMNKLKRLYLNLPEPQMTPEEKAEFERRQKLAEMSTFDFIKEWVKKSFTEGIQTRWAEIMSQIVNIDEERNKAGMEAIQYANQIRQAKSPEEIKMLTDKLREKNREISMSLAEKLAYHGINLGIDLLTFTLTAIPRVVGYMLKTADTVGQTAFGNIDKAEFRDRLNKVAENVIPIAFDFMAFNGAIKTVRKKLAKKPVGEKTASEKVVEPEKRTASEMKEDTIKVVSDLEDKIARMEKETKQGSAEKVKPAEEIKSAEEIKPVKEGKPIEEIKTEKSKPTEEIKPVEEIKPTEEIKTEKPKFELIEEERPSTEIEKQASFWEEKPAVELNIKEFNRGGYEAIKSGREGIQIDSILKEENIIKNKTEIINLLDKRINKINERIDTVGKMHSRFLDWKEKFIKENPDIYNKTNKLINKIEKNNMNIIDNLNTIKKISTQILDIAKKEIITDLDIAEIKANRRALYEMNARILNEGKIQSKAINNLDFLINKKFEVKTPKQQIKPEETIKEPEIDKKMQVVEEKVKVEGKTPVLAKEEADFYFSKNDLSPQIKNIKESPNLKKFPDIKEVVDKIMKGTVNLQYLYKTIKNLDIKKYIDEKLQHYKLPFFGTISMYEYLNRLNMPEISIIVDAIENGVNLANYNVVKYLKKVDSLFKKHKIDKQQFFSDYEAGRYDWIIDKIMNKEKIDFKKLKPDELIAYKIKFFTDMFADILGLREKIGTHGHALYRKRYLPHIMLNNIKKVILERNRELTREELNFINLITGKNYGSVFEIPRTLDLPHITDPIQALEIYSGAVIKKISQDMQKDIFYKMIEKVKEKETIARNKLEEFTKIEIKLKNEIDRFRFDEKKYDELMKDFEKLRHKIVNDPTLNVNNYKSIREAFEAYYDIVARNALWEDKLFFQGLNNANPVLTFITNIYLKSPTKKNIDIKNPKLVHEGNAMFITGKIKGLDGVWRDAKYTLREFFGDRPVSKIIMDMKGLSTASFIGMSAITTLVNLFQHLNIYALMKPNLIKNLKYEVGSATDVMRALFDERVRRQLRRSGVFNDIQRLYKELEFGSEGKISKAVEFSLWNMKISELFNRSMDFFIAKKALIDKNKKLQPSDTLTPKEIELLAKHVTDYINFKYTPLHNEFVLQTGLGRIGLHLGSFSLKQLRLLTDMWRNYARDPYVKKFVAFLKSKKDPLKFVDNLNNEGRFALMKWFLLNVSILYGVKAIADIWLFQVDPKRQIIPPVPPIMVNLVYNMLIGCLELFSSQPERGINKILNGLSGFIPMYKQISRIILAIKENEPAYGLFPKTSFQEKEPEMR